MNSAHASPDGHSGGATLGEPTWCPRSIEPTEGDKPVILQISSDPDLTTNPSVSAKVETDFVPIFAPSIGTMGQSIKLGRQMNRSARYGAFISYSHSASREVARGLQKGLQTYAKPWYRWRAINVFRDETDLTAAPA